METSFLEMETLREEGYESGVVCASTARLARTVEFGVLIKEGFYDYISTTKIMSMFICLIPVSLDSLSRETNYHSSSKKQEARVKQQ